MAALEKELKQITKKVDDAAEKADQTRRISYGFIVRTGIGADGVMQAAVRTNNGTVKSK